MNTKEVLKNGGIPTKLLLLLAIICLCLLMVSPITLVISVLKFPEVTNLKLIQLISTIGLTIIPAFIFANTYSSEPKTFLSLDKKTDWTAIVYVLLIMIISIPFINLIGDLNQRMILPKAFIGLETWMKDLETQAGQLTEKIVKVHSIYGLGFNILLIAVIPAVGEELIFRGVLQGILKEWKGVKIAIWITAIIFSAIHMQFYGFIPRMLMGAFFGYLLFWSGNMWLPIAAHFTNNVIAVIFYYLKFNGYQLPDIDGIGIGNTLWLGIASGGLAVFGFFQLKKHFLIRNL
jgi:uncharacterized protein